MKQLLPRCMQLAVSLVAIALYIGPALADTEQEINQIEDRRYDAMVAVDTQALAKILADEFVYHQPTGNVATKASYLEQLKSGRVQIKPAAK
jgi:hypothetical protein